jgi:PadR family transcriptional regulator, regulatory protein PadR
MKQVRMTLAVAMVLRVFLEEPEEPRYGYELMRRTGFPSGKLYPILARLQAAGWLVKQVEEIDPVEAGRLARRLYQLEPGSVARIRAELAELSAQLDPGPAARPGRLRPQGGPA